LLIAKWYRGFHSQGDDVRNELEPDDYSSEDDEGGILENLERDDEGLDAPTPADSVHGTAADAGPPTFSADSSELVDALTDSESSSSATSLRISTTGPRTTTPSSDQSVHIEQFPGSFAGMPVDTVGSEPGYIRYAGQLGLSDNPWAPFNSKLDWEIARWAKLRGPGSTAVTDLLSINGVRFSNRISFLFLIKPNHSYKKHLTCRTKIHVS